MGILRLILALSVVADHEGVPLKLLHFSGSQSAVEGFFVISGYLIFLILQKDYPIKWAFYANRFLRIYPMYWLLLGLYFVAQLISPMKNHLNLPFIIINVFLFTLDFFVIRDLAHHKPIENTIVIAQSWSLSLEIYFYFLAPYLAKIPKRILLGITFVILTTKASFFIFGSITDPYSYRFFPFEIGFFLLGACSYNFIKLKSNALAMFTIIFSLLWGLIGGGSKIEGNDLKSMIFPVIIAIALPSLSNWDQQKPVKFIGTLSYPIYLSHILIGDAIHKIAFKLGLVLNAWFKYIILLVATCLFSVLVQFMLEQPVQKFRNRIKKIASSKLKVNGQNR
jgi:peptidoglycan/LPS O-acetylase OafA/YrhL